MPSGARRHFITIESPPADFTVLNEEAPAWVKVRDLRAQIAPLRGRALESARMLATDVTHEVTFPWFAGVTADMRIVYSGRIFNIVYPLNVDEKNREWQLLCREIVA